MRRRPIADLGDNHMAEHIPRLGGIALAVPKLAGTSNDRPLSEKLLIGSAAANGIVVVIYASGLVSTACAALGQNYSSDINNFLIAAACSLISLFVVERLKKRTVRRFVALVNLLFFLNAAATS